MSVCDKKQLKLGMVRCQIVRHEGDVDRYTLAVYTNIVFI